MKNETLPPLPLEWTKQIFKRFSVTYGPALMGGIWGNQLEDVLLFWAEDLAAFKDHPGAIKHALEHLPPEYPPNLIQFKELCRDGMRQSAQKHPALTSQPTEMPESVKKQIMKIVCKTALPN